MRSTNGGPLNILCLKQKTHTCASCGVPLFDLKMCSYCKCLIDNTLNEINERAFQYGGIFTCAVSFAPNNNMQSTYCPPYLSTTRKL